jgi:hypothetical protein
LNGTGKRLLLQGPLLRRRTPELIALEWRKQLKKETSYRAVLEKEIADGQDITHLVKDLEKKEREKIERSISDNLPF